MTKTRWSRTQRTARTDWSATTTAMARARKTIRRACRAPSRFAKRSPNRCRRRHCWARGPSSDRTAAARSVGSPRGLTNQALLHQAAPSVAFRERRTHPFMIGEPASVEDSRAERRSSSRRAASSAGEATTPATAGSSVASPRGRLSAGRVSGVEHGSRSRRVRGHDTRSGGLLGDAQRRSSARRRHARPRFRSGGMHAIWARSARRTALGKRLTTSSRRGVATRSTARPILSPPRRGGPQANLRV